VLLEPPCSELSYVFECSWFLKEMAWPQGRSPVLSDSVAGHKLASFSWITGYHATDHEQSGETHAAVLLSEIWSPTA